MKCLSISIVSLLTLISASKAQIDTIRYFESYFETSEDRGQWVNVPSDIHKNWIFNSKGGYLNPFDGMNYNPEAAYEGEFNAFHAWSDFNPDIRKIVSIPIDLSDSKKPELTFAHAMFESVFGSNTLAVLFKAGKNASWDTIISFYNPINEWTTHSLNIKDYGSKYLCKDFQIAFQSQARGEFGVCIDSVVIVEKDVIVRYAKSVKINHVDQNPLPTGATDLPLMRIDVIVVGNTDSIMLNSIEFTSLSSHDSLFAHNGFELVATRDSSYRPVKNGTSLKIGDAVSISNGKITFSDIKYKLSTGFNAIWLIADIKKTAPHNSIADFKIDAGAIKIGNVYWPGTEVSPYGHNVIEEAVFFDDFEDTGIWEIAPDFEVAIPKGYSAGITKDPDFAYSGLKILGNDLTVDGKYLLNINEANAYYAVSPVINLKYYNDVKLSFKKWIAFEGNDHGVIEVSVDNGATWIKIWDSKKDALTPDNDWGSYVLGDEFNKIAAHKPEVKIRFGIIFSDGNFSYAGFNIDNFAITGNYLTNDVGIIDVSAPTNDCHNPGKDSVTITIRNYADGPTASVIPVFFSIDGSEGTRVTENIPGPIPRDGTLTYTFKTPANFPAPGDYQNFTVKVQLPGDEDIMNDFRVKSIFIQKSVGIPYYEDFETHGGFWKSYGDDPRWLCKIPEGSIPPEFGNSWISSPFGNYLTNDTSYLESSCYNLVSEDKLILQLNYWIDSEPGKDGALIEYSVDNGLTWTEFPAHSYEWDWNWYNDHITSLGKDGWSGLNISNWITARQMVPEALLNKPTVKFRIVWGSDEENTFRGLAIDDVNVYAAPPDIGISGIDSFANRCQGVNPDFVRVSIKNMGINALRKNDTIIAGFALNNEKIVVDTFLLASNLAPGNIVKHTFSKKVDVSEPGSYNLKAFTLIEDDPWFYQANNDTLSIDFEVYPAPVTSLIDTIQTYIPDTVILETIFDDTYDYWWNGIPGSNTYNVDRDGWHKLKVTATRGNGCTAYDSTNVELLFHDAGAFELVHPVDGCGFSKQENPIVRIMNYGTDSIYAGQKIAVFFSLNEGPLVSDTMQLTTSLHAGNTIDFTIRNKNIDLSEKGIYNFKIFTSLDGDTIQRNDTITRSIEILGRPSVSLGPDMTVLALSHTLDPGEGYSGYKWDNGLTTQTREITESGSYWVRVYDENNCDDLDTVYIRLKIRDIMPDSLLSPQSGCLFDSESPLALRIVNLGNDTLLSGSSLTVSYRVNENDPVSEIVTLQQDLIPGKKFIHTLTGKIDLSNEGDYSLELTTIVSGDLRQENDTLDKIVFRYAKPVVDFGLDNPSFIEDASVLLDAGYNPYYEYDWQDTATTHKYLVEKSGPYYVTVTDTRTKCFGKDSVFINLVYTDIGVTWSDMPSSGCKDDSYNVRIRVTNHGTSYISGKALIRIGIDVNGERFAIDTLVRAEGSYFNPGTDLELDLTEKIAVSGKTLVEIYTLFELDNKKNNDTLSVMYETLSPPEIDFGEENGVLTVELPYILDAGPGYKSYLWQDNSTAQTFRVTEAGNYQVTVTGMNNCEASKSVRVEVLDAIGEVNENYGIILYPNPNNGLFHIRLDEQTEDVTLRIISNNGQQLYINTLTPDQIRNESINIQELPNGIYFILIHSGDRIYRGKIVIE